MITFIAPPNMLGLLITACTQYYYYDTIVRTHKTYVNPADSVGTNLISEQQRYFIIFFNRIFLFVQDFDLCHFISSRFIEDNFIRVDPHHLSGIIGNLWSVCCVLFRRMFFFFMLPLIFNECVFLQPIRLIEILKIMFLTNIILLVVFSLTFSCRSCRILCSQHRAYHVVLAQLGYSE